jgi:hypothetical protein
VRRRPCLPNHRLSDSIHLQFEALFTAARQSPSPAGLAVALVTSVDEANDDDGRAGTLLTGRGRSGHVNRTSCPRCLRLSDAPMALKATADPMPDADAHVAKIHSDSLALLVNAIISSNVS